MDNLQKSFIANWETAFDKTQEITSSESEEEAKIKYNEYQNHPLTTYGYLDISLAFENKKNVQFCMEKILEFSLHEINFRNFNNPNFEPLGQIMLKPLIQYPLTINNSNIINNINWILVGYSMLFGCYKKDNIEAYDSLRTIGCAIEQNRDDFAFLIFSSYLGINDYSNAYTKYLIFTFYKAAEGFKEFGYNEDEYEYLHQEALSCGEWYNSRNQTMQIAQLIEEGERIAEKLYDKILIDINLGKINTTSLTVPQF